MSDGLTDEPFPFGEVHDFIEAFDIGMFLPDDIALPAHEYFSDGLFFGFNFSLEIVNLVVEFEDQPAKIIGMLAVDLFRFLLHDLLNCSY